MSETFEQKTERNKRVQARYDELMAEGKHGHYETLFQVVREEVERTQSTVAPGEMDGLDRAQMTELATAIGELSRAMGSPCVFGKYPATLLSATVRQAAFRLSAA